MNEFIQEFQEKQTHTVEEWKNRQLFFENHEIARRNAECRTAEIQRLTAELSEMRKLNQSFTAEQRRS